MTKTEYKKERLQLLNEMNNITDEHCDNCEIMKQLNGKNEITARTNACKSCPIGNKLSQYGNRLMNLKCNK